MMEIASHPEGVNKMGVNNRGVTSGGMTQWNGNSGRGYGDGQTDSISFLKKISDNVRAM